MIRTGFAMVHPTTQTRTVVTETEVESGGHGFTIEVTVPPGVDRTILEHLHEHWTESFEILAGSAHYRLGGVERSAQVGETVVMPPRVPHVHPWNASPDAPMIYRQQSRFAVPSADAVQDTLGSFATMNGLAGEGKVNAAGLPSHPLQLAATLRALGRHGGYSTRMPIGVQKVLSHTMGRLAEWMGYRGSYSRYEG